MIAPGAFRDRFTRTGARAGVGVLCTAVLAASPTDVGAGTRAWLAAHAGGDVVVIGGTEAVSAAVAGTGGDGGAARTDSDQRS